MTQNQAYLKLSTSLEQFNSGLNQSDKLNQNALKTIQQYLKDPGVKISNEDERKMQHPLKQLELLTDQVILDRITSTILKEIDHQLINLAKLITDYPEESKENPFYIIVKLKVCFIEILSPDAIKSSEERRKRYEKRLDENQTIDPSREKQHLHALYMERQQQIINELMTAAIFDVLEYLYEKKQDFNEHFNQKLLDLFQKKTDDSNFLIEDQMGNDFFNILSKTARDCNLKMSDLIYNLRYAIVGFGEVINDYTIPLQNYVLDTESPSLKGFNETVKSSSALSSEVVDKFQPLFELYYKILHSCQLDEEESQASNASESELPAPPIEHESDLKGIWIKPNSQLEACCKELENIMKPGDLSSYSAKELSSAISENLYDSRIYMCLSAKQVHDVLPGIHKENVVYRVYVLCENEAEEADFQKEKNKFNKIRLITSNKEVFLREFAVDILSSVIEIADKKLKAEDLDGASRIFVEARKNILKYDGGKNFSLTEIDAKIEQCSRPLK